MDMAVQKYAQRKTRHGKYEYVWLMKRKKERFCKYVMELAYDKIRRTRTFLSVGMAVNCIFSIYNLANGFLCRSSWLIAVGVYYLVLNIMKAFAVKQISLISQTQDDIEKQKNKSEKQIQNCGKMLLILGIAMSGMCVQVVLNQESYVYPGHLIYLSAAYTFSCLASSVKKFFPAEKGIFPELFLAKMISISQSLMSVFTLQTALLTRFGKDMECAVVLNAATGGVVCMAVMGIAVFMIFSTLTDH